MLRLNILLLNHSFSNKTSDISYSIKLIFINNKNQSEATTFLRVKLMKKVKTQKNLIFLATIINKVSQMFSQISSTYLQVMLNKKAVNYSPPFRIKQSQISEDSDFSFQQSQQDIVQNNQTQQSPPKQQQKQIIKEQKITERYEQRHLKEDREKNVERPSKNIEQRVISPPKTPPSSYLLFFQQHRGKIAQQFPNLSITQLNKIASQLWKELLPEEKNHYQQLYNIEKQKYFEDLKLYNQTKGGQKIRKSSTKKRGRPKKLSSNVTQQIKGEQKDQNSQNSSQLI